MASNNGIMTLTDERWAELIAATKTKGKAEDYRNCVTRLLDEDGNAWTHVESEFPGRLPATVKTALGNAIKELEAPMIVGSNEELGVYLVKTA